MNASEIETKLQTLDAMIEKCEAEAEKARAVHNIERALYMEGKAKGLSDAHRIFSAIVGR